MKMAQRVRLLWNVRNQPRKVVLEDAHSLVCFQPLFNIFCFVLILEPNMNELINTIFGDPLIYLDCAQAGECLHESQLPDWKPPPNPSFSNSSIIIMSLTAILIVIGALSGLSWLKNRDRGYSETDDTRPLMDEEEVREQEQHIMANHTPSTLCFSNICYSLEERSNSFNFPLSTNVPAENSNSLMLLKGIKGFVCPGEVLAIMGGSGAGKTTFLDILARKNKRGLISGDISVNGKIMDIQEYKSIIGYVRYMFELKICRPGRYLNGHVDGI